MRIYLPLIIIYTLVAGTASFVINYHNERDLNAWINRAQVAADHTDMLEYLGNYTDELEERGLTSGHTVLIFKKPDNDLALHYRAVTRIVERLVDQVSNMEPDSPEYQTAIDDLRGTCRELEFIAGGVTWVQLHWLLWFGIIGWVSFLWWFFFGD